MAAAVQTLHVNPNVELNNQPQQFNHYVKPEVPTEPAFMPQPPPPPQAAADLVNNFPPVLTKSETGFYTPLGTATPPMDKVKRARKPAGPKAKKAKADPVVPLPDPLAVTAVAALNNGASQSQIPDHMPVQKKKRDRFKGTTEEEVLTRVLPDHIREDLDILIVGINPGLTAAYIQHHYAGPGNHFWKCLYLSELIPEAMNAMQDAELLNYGIGFTNIVARTTRGSADLTRKEIAEGGEILKVKMLEYLPKIALFNGKGIYEVFCGHKKFYFGLQPDHFPGCPNTVVFVNPSSSARCTQLPRAADKVPFFEALKRVRDHIRAHGSIEGIDRSTVTFPDFKLVTAPQKVKKEVKAEPTEGGAQPNGVQHAAPQAGVIIPQQPLPDQPSKKAPAKPKKPRGRPKKEPTTTQPEQPNQALNAVPQPTLNNTQSAPQQMNLQQHQTQQQQQHMPPQLVGQMQQNQQMQPQMPPHQQINPFMNNMPMQQMHNEQSEAHQNINNISAGQQQQQTTQQQMGGGDNIKREVLEGNHHDKDLAAVIQHSINIQQSMYQQSMAASMMQHQGMNGNGLHPGLMLQMQQQQQPGSGVKQETPDWPGYGVMPPVTSAPPTTLGAYQQYSFWDYLPHAAAAGASGAPYMTNPYSSIQAPQIAHQQAVAAAAALQSSAVSMAQQQQQQQAQAVQVAAPQQPQIPTYSSPQNPSSPAMSSHSNLTQASLDSLPKADSASTVANWLQNIPNSSK